MIKRVILLMLFSFVLSSIALALRLERWQKVHKSTQGNIHYVDRTTLTTKNNEWSFRYKVFLKKERSNLYAYKHCMLDNNGLVSKETFIRYCDSDNKCIDHVDTEWRPYDPQTVGYLVCKMSLPVCGDKDDNRDFCRNPPNEGTIDEER